MAETLPPPAGIDVLEAMYTTRAMRRLKPDPIPAETLRAILDAAIRGPSGGNSQGWAFVAVQDPALKLQLEEVYRPALEALFQPGGPYHKPLNSEDAELAARTRKMADSALHLAHHLHEAPVIIVPCVRTGGRPTDISTGSSIYPAVQNLMIAARAFGIGSTLTTVHRMRQDDVRAALGIPADYETAALIPLGYPRGRWGVAARRPVEEVAFGDRWGEPLP
ncbi:MAG: nitroreductase family protein [Thermoflexaceae bacterium]|nr:nitroreductase family protein [Thermoflexaceae bacterium]